MQVSWKRQAWRATGLYYASQKRADEFCPFELSGKRFVVATMKQIELKANQKEVKQKKAYRGQYVWYRSELW